MSNPQDEREALTDEIKEAFVAQFGDDRETYLGRDGSWYIEGFKAARQKYRAALANQRAEAGQSADERELRRMLCVKYAGAAAYMDDGEAQDNRAMPCIDFMRDSPAEILRKMQARAIATSDPEGHRQAIADNEAEAAPQGGRGDTTERCLSELRDVRDRLSAIGLTGAAEATDKNIKVIEGGLPSAVIGQPIAPPSPQPPAAQAPLIPVFLEAMEWGRDNWARFSMSGHDHREVAEQFAERALGIGTAKPAQIEPEAGRPDILERLTYHALERDDLTLDECLDFLANEWRKVHGRTDRQMVMQILALLAAQPEGGITAPAGGGEG